MFAIRLLTVTIIGNHVKLGVSLRVLYCEVDTGYGLGRSLGDCRSPILTLMWFGQTLLSGVRRGSVKNQNCNLPNTSRHEPLKTQLCALLADHRHFPSSELNLGVIAIKSRQTCKLIGTPKHSIINA